MNIYRLYVIWLGISLTKKEDINGFGFVGFSTGIESFSEIQNTLYKNGYLDVVPIGDNKHREMLDCDYVIEAQKRGALYKLFVTPEGIDYINAMADIYDL